MDLAREKFVDHFQIVLDVQCFWHWPKRGRKTAPTWLSGTIYEWMKASAGDIQTTQKHFAETIDPLIEELHETTPQGKGLDRNSVTGLIYDRLAAAGIEVRIGPGAPTHSRRGEPG
jgi:hypothetical protein